MRFGETAAAVAALAVVGAASGVAASRLAAWEESRPGRSDASSHAADGAAGSAGAGSAVSASDRCATASAAKGSCSGSNAAQPAPMPLWLQEAAVAHAMASARGGSNTRIAGVAPSSARGAAGTGTCVVCAASRRAGVDDKPLVKAAALALAATALLVCSLWTLYSLAWAGTWREAIMTVSASDSPTSIPAMAATLLLWLCLTAVELAVGVVVWASPLVGVAASAFLAAAAVEAMGTDPPVEPATVTTGVINDAASVVSAASTAVGGEERNAAGAIVVAAPPSARSSRRKHRRRRRRTRQRASGKAESGDAEGGGDSTDAVQGDTGGDDTGAQDGDQGDAAGGADTGDTGDDTADTGDDTADTESGVEAELQALWQRVDAAHDAFTRESVALTVELLESPSCAALAVKAGSKQQAERLWRLARARNGQRLLMARDHPKASAAVKQQLLALTDKGVAFAEQALALDETNANAHKWIATVLAVRALYCPLKQVVGNAYKIRDHAIRAAELNPSDPFNHYGVGQWYEVVAGLGYTKRKLAAWVFGKEVKGTYEQAYEYFKRGEDTRPRFWVRSALKLASVCGRLGKKEEGRRWLQQAQDMRAQGAEWEQDDTDELACAGKLLGVRV